MRRLANLDDLSIVHSIYMDESVVRYLGYDPMGIEAFRKVYEDLVESGCFFAYEDSGEIAGFYKASRYPGRASHVACLGTLAVAPRFKGKGLAERMVREAIGELRESGAKRIELVVESDNPRAISFYPRLGFQIEGTLRKFYKRAREDHYVDDHIMSVIFD